MEECIPDIMKKIEIEIGNSIKSVQEQFSSLFPFLKINFLYDVLPRKEFSHNGGKSEPIARTMQHFGGFRENGVIYMDCNKTVSELEKDFEKMFGLHVEVLRKSGTLWIETSLTDDWTLEQQNREGELLSG